jgi:hypothetical protein
MIVRFQLFFKEFSGIGGVVFYKDVEMTESPVIGDKLKEVNCTVEKIYTFSPVSDIPIEVTAVLKKESVFRKFKVFDKHFPEIQIVLKDFDYGEKELTLTFGKMGNTTFEEKIYSNAPFIWKLHERNDKSNISEHIFVNWIIEEVNGRPHVILQIEHRMSEIVSCTY